MEGTEATAEINVGIDFITPPTEAELMGIESESSEASSEPDSTSTETDNKGNQEGSEGSGGEADSGEHAGTEQAAPQEGEAEAQADSEPGKPPKGFIPKAAMHEARAENRYLKERIAELEAQAAGKQQEQPTHEESEDPWADFQVLSPEEFAELAEDDPTEALIYSNNLKAYESYQAHKNETERNQKVTAQAAWDRMAEAVPGLFDQDSEVQAEFKQFADELGFNENMLFLTDPEVRVLMPGDKTPRMLGEHAAALVEVLAGVKSKLAGLDREAIKAEVAKEIRGDIEKELLAKFKQSDPDGYKSLSSIQSSGGETDFGGHILSEAEFGKLSAAEQERYLAGA